MVGITILSLSVLEDARARPIRFASICNRARRPTA